MEVIIALSVVALIIVAYCIQLYLGCKHRWIMTIRNENHHVIQCVKCYKRRMRTVDYSTREVGKWFDMDDF